jgi:ribosomal protein L24E
MRNVLLAGMTLALSATTSVPAAAGVAPNPLTPPVVQRQSGVAFGTVGVDVVANPPKSRLTDSGHYESSGQLGRGTYRFDLTFDSSACNASVTTITAGGTARLVRSDGAVLTGTAAESFGCYLAGVPPVKEAVSVVLTHGSRDLLGANLLFSGTRTYLATPTGDIGPESFVFSGRSSARPRIGYWMVNAAGVVHAFGGVDALGGGSSRFAFAHIEATPTRNGYWLVDTGGRVSAFGDAHAYGNAPRDALVDDIVISLVSTPTGRGYWLFTSHGRVVPFGDAQFFGDRHLLGLNGSVVGAVGTPSGRGYYMVAADGGVFTFGDAKFRGSTGAMHLNQPVVGLVPTVDGTGYWLVAADGGVFAFHAPFRGSMGGSPLAQPVIGMVRYGTGYMMVARDGGIFNFSRGPFFGSLGGSPSAGLVVGVALIE